MIVRIRLSQGRSRRKLGSGARRAALVCAALLAPVALMAWALGCWGLLADMEWAAGFAIREGLFSHWQVWMALGVGVQFTAFLLSRLARPEDEPGEPEAEQSFTAVAGRREL